MHSPERQWQQTNCYADLWIEILASLGCEPAAAFGFTVAQDFEGDQFTFFKPPLDELEALFGLRINELALYDDLIAHIERQLEQRRLVLIELDSYYMPDTRGVSYRDSHGKTTIAINRLDRARREIDYFHNDGFHRAVGDDFDGLLRLLPEQTREDALFPYAETVRLPSARANPNAPAPMALDILARHVKRAPAGNPIAAYRQMATEHADALIERPSIAFHHYAFNTLRQLGANFELLASHLRWLETAARENFDESADFAQRIAEGAKIAQFQLARGLRQRRFDRFDAALAPLCDAHDALLGGLRARFAA
ncbi:DUF1839 family protein [Terrarubrum flagellatum]|uniref:DUF1839 family protein n=1 Tax=Terrirubrum flagellatum TaxID=2895980 RepID=UPI0031455921